MIERRAFLVTRLGLAVLTLAAAGTVFGQTAARVEDLNGIASAVRADGSYAALAPDAEIRPGDTVRTERDSTARLRFSDGTVVALRPSSAFRLDAFSYIEPAPQRDAFVVRLLRGGFRQVTGLLAKRSPKAYNAAAATATIGIRGTDFSVRMCEADCAQEGSAGPAPRPPVELVARVVLMDGVAAATREAEAPRVLEQGAAIYEREAIGTGARSHAVLVFRDGSRISLAENSVLAIRSYRFDPSNRTGAAELAHLAGGASVMTGDIAKQGPRHYRFVTPLGEVRPHGTLFGSVVDAGKQVVENTAGAAKQVVDTVTGFVKDGISEAQQLALNTATAPLLRDLNLRVSQLRSNPPTTEAEWNRVTSEITRVSGMVKQAVQTAIAAAGSAKDASAFKTMVGLTIAANLEALAVTALPLPLGPGVDAGIAGWGALQAQVGAIAKDNDPYLRDSLRAVGLSAPDLERVVQPEGRFTASTIIATEVSSTLAAQGMTAARDVFTAVQATAASIQERVQQAALDAAITPITRQMTALMTELRTNPSPSADLVSRMTRLSSDLQSALTTAIGAAGAAADSTAFKTMVGMALATEFESLAVFGQAGGTFTDVTISFWAALQANVATARNTPYLRDSLALVGLSDPDLARVQDNRFTASTIIATEVGSYLGSQGSAAARDFFAGAQAAAQAMDRRAQQAAEAARNAAVKDGIAAKLSEDSTRLKQAAQAGATTGSQIAQTIVDTGADAAKTAIGSAAGAVETGLANALPAAIDAARTAAAGADGLRTAIGNAAAGIDAGIAEVLGGSKSDSNSLPCQAGSASGPECGSAPRGEPADSGSTATSNNDAKNLEDARGLFGGASPVAGKAEKAGRSGDGEEGSSTVYVWDGAVEVAGRVINKDEILRAAANGQLVVATGGVWSAGAPRPDLIVVDLKHVFGEPGSGKNDAGVYVVVHDGAVSLAQKGVEIVLVKGETGFADARANPPQRLDIPPTFLRRDVVLGAVSIVGMICRP